MNDLRDVLLGMIRAEGSIGIDTYMTQCLLHPRYGYYATRDPFGAQGDFVTAPEISQMFGELIGLALAQCWLDQGRPAPFTLAELGPGRGTLMRDALRAAATVPGFIESGRIALIEASATLRSLQGDILKGYDIDWASDVHALAEAPLFLIANEFFDALPVRQYHRGDTGWCECRIASRDGDLIRVLSPEAPMAPLSHRLADTGKGDVVEFCPQIAPIVGAIAGRIARHGGAALIVDYGGWRSLGDTVQAVRAHRKTHILDTPGQADLTAHVDFEALSSAATRSGARPTRMTPQGLFLERLGITSRARALASAATREIVSSAHRRLTHPDEMGNLFKVLGIYAPGANAPPGLDP